MIKPMLFAEKAQKFGPQFSNDYAKIMSCNSDEELKQFIDSIDDPQHKILIADTFFSIRKGHEKVSKNNNL